MEHLPAKDHVEVTMSSPACLGAGPPWASVRACGPKRRNDNVGLPLTIVREKSVGKVFFDGGVSEIRRLNTWPGLQGSLRG